jgi:hypothetical protein
MHEKVHSHVQVILQGVDCNVESGGEVVTMMQSAEPRHGNDFAVCSGVVSYLPVRGRLLV